MADTKISGFDPATVLADLELAAEQGGNNVRVPIALLGTGKARFRATKSGAQAGITAAENTQVTFDTEVSDILGLFSSNGWTPPAGPVFLHAHINFAGTNLDAQEQRIVIMKNGVEIATARVRSLTALSAQGDCLTHDLADGDDVYTVSTLAFTTSGTYTIAQVGTCFQGFQL